MASTNSLKVTSYARKKYNVTAPIDVDVAKNYIRAVVAIATADGELAQRELDWFVEEQHLLGLPSDLIEENILK